MATRLTKSKTRPEKQYSRRAQTKQPVKRVRSRAVSSLREISGDLCTCQRLSHEVFPSLLTPQEQQDIAEIVLLPRALGQQLHTRLDALLAQEIPFSLFVFHVVQVEREVAHDLDSAYRAACYLHPAPGFMRQLQDKVQRVLRSDDHLLVQGEGGALLLLPSVEQKGAYSILERLYTQVDLLEAETVIPPLKHETHIVIGCSSYPEQGETREQLLRQAEQCARRVTLRPRIVVPGESSPAHPLPSIVSEQARESNQRHQCTPCTTPFLKLPSSLPKRLMRLIPYALACQLRCVPVGKEHLTLTVAMLDPHNRENISYLAQFTGMTIFPVACMQEDLDILLATKW